MSSPKKIIVIVGPTSSGKSELAIKMAKIFNGEVVSADSRQIYRGMDIGTAKDKEQIAKSGIPHHLIDIRSPNEEYSLAEYKRDAIRAIRGILRRKKLPILVGGTGLYIKAVVENLEIPKAKADAALRKNLELRIKNKGLNSLAEELLRLDSEAAHTIDLKNPRRVIRALEVAIITGKPFTAQRKKGRPLFDALVIGIKIPPNKLRERINKRVDEMIKAGLADEVRNLVKQYGENAKALNTIGYSEIIRAFGKLSAGHLAADSRGFGTRINADALVLPNEVAEQIKQNTRAYAKRQMTWFKKDKNVRWIKTAQEVHQSVKKFLKK